MRLALYVAGIALAVTSSWLPSRVEALDDMDGIRGTINCGDPGNRSICLDCCTDDDCPCQQNACLSCCLDDDGCDIVNEPPTTGLTGLTIKLAAVVGAVKLQFQRKGVMKGGLPTVDIKLKETFLSGPQRPVVTLRAQLTGPDASLGGLLFPIAFLDSGPGALDTLRARGLDVSLVGSPPVQTCQDVLPAPVCTTLARRLSASIDSALAVGDGVERAAFLAQAAALGFPPCGPRTP